MRPITLGSSNLGSGFQSTASGWGQLGANVGGPEFLHYVSKPIITNAECNRHWGNSIMHTQICTLKGVGVGT